MNPPSLWLFGMGGNILDLVFTSDPKRILEVDYGPPLENVKIGHTIIHMKYER